MLSQNQLNNSLVTDLRKEGAMNPKRYYLKCRPWSHSYMEEQPDPKGCWIYDPEHKIDVSHFNYDSDREPTLTGIGEGD